MYLSFVNKKYYSESNQHYTHSIHVSCMAEFHPEKNFWGGGGGGGEAASSANCGIAATYSVDSSNSSEFKGLSESHGEK